MKKYLWKINQHAEPRSLSVWDSLTLLGKITLVGLIITAIVVIAGVIGIILN